MRRLKLNYEVPDFERMSERMAEMMPDEGLDIVLGQMPGSTVKYTSPLNLALFTSQSATTVILHNNSFATITETVYTSYARQSLAAATWGAIAERPTNIGRQQTYPQVTFPTVGATGATINGFYITNNAHTVCLGQANFDDLTAVPVLTNDVIKVTPTWAYLH